MFATKGQALCCQCRHRGPDPIDILYLFSDSAFPLPFPKRPLKKYRQIIDLLHDGYIQT